LYQVSFYLAGNPDAGPGVKSAVVTASVSSNTYFFDTNTGGTGGGHTTLTDMGWIKETFSFIAGNSVELLSFESSVTGGGTPEHPAAFGPALDNVSILDRGEGPAPTPLPAALPLFAGGLGLIGLLARRRKLKARAAVA
jgi:hypothetical protein